MRGTGCLLLVMLLEGTALAKEDAVCGGPSIELAPELARRPGWLQAVEETRRRFTGRRDVDRCATLAVEPAAGAASVSVRSSRGRSVTRSVESPDDLQATALALLVLPPPAERPSNVEAPERRPSAAEPVDQGGQASQAASASSGAGATFELGLGPSGRVAGKLRGPGVALLGDVAVSGWVLGLAASGDLMSRTTAALPGELSRLDGFSTAALFGRRFAFGSFGVDVGIAAPVFAIQRRAWATTTGQPDVSLDGEEPAEMEPLDSDDGSSGSTVTVTARHGAVRPDLRAGAFLRVAAKLKGSAHLFALFSADRTLGLVGRGGSEVPPDAPVYGAGLSIGLLWSAL